MQIYTEIIRFKAAPVLAEQAKKTARDKGMTLSEFARLALRDKIKETSLAA